MTNLDSILKRRDITLTAKVRLVKAMVFPVMYGCEIWTIKKAEYWEINAFELWCWRRHLRVLWTARRLHQWILKEINPEYTLEGLVLKLKLQYFGHLMQRTDSFEKTLMLGMIEGRRYRGRQRMRWHHGRQSHHQLNGCECEQTMEVGEGQGEGQGTLVSCHPWSCKESDTTEHLKNNNNIMSASGVMKSDIYIHYKMIITSLVTICVPLQYYWPYLLCSSLLFNWKFVPLSLFYLFHLPPSPLQTIHLFSLWVYVHFVLILFFKILFIIWG